MRDGKISCCNLNMSTFDWYPQNNIWNSNTRISSCVQNKDRLFPAFLHRKRRWLFWFVKIESTVESIMRINYVSIMFHYENYKYTSGEELECMVMLVNQHSDQNIPFQSTRRKPIKEWKLLGTFQWSFPQDSKN